MNGSQPSPHSQRQVPPLYPVHDPWLCFKVDLQRPAGAALGDSIKLIDVLEKIEESARTAAASGLAVFVSPEELQSLFKNGDAIASLKTFEKPAQTKMGLNTGSVALARRDPGTGFVFVESEWVFEEGPPARTMRLFAILASDGLALTFGQYFIKPSSWEIDAVKFLHPSNERSSIERVNDAVSNMIRMLHAEEKLGPNDEFWNMGYLNKRLF